MDEAADEAAELFYPQPTISDREQPIVLDLQEEIPIQPSCQRVVLTVWALDHRSVFEAFEAFETEPMT